MVGQPLRASGTDDLRPELADTLEDDRGPNSSKVILEALDQADRAFAPYMAFCRTVDAAYSLTATTAYASDISDEAFDLFWASMEILKPAIYAKPPKPVATPRFKDGGRLEKTVAELIERCLGSTFDRGDMDQVMLGVRDDLALTNRGVAWLTYETDKEGGGQRVCIEHLDRSDFLHEPARSWTDVGWVARRGWLTKREMRERFPKSDAWQNAAYSVRREERDHGSADNSAKAGVWEVWSKADNRVYWVTEGVDDILEEAEPHLNLRGFFPCPKPAFGTLHRRSLVPVPDYRRYRHHLGQIKTLTSRIYTLLERVKLKVLIPAGGDIGTAVETALKSEDDSLVIPVPAAAFTGASAGNLMLTLPLAEVATTIQGLIEARGQLIEDFYQLSGISDIMRGATEAEETLGAQQLKSQYGSVRVRDKIDELARMARDIAAIAAEIIAANFSEKSLLDLSRMTIPKRAEVEKKRKQLGQSARDALEKLRDEAERMAQGQQLDPEQAAQAKQQFDQQQQAIVAQYGPLIREMAETVVIEDVMDMLRDEKTRNLVIDIETDSTILTDENAEKQSRSEFLQAFANASASIMPLLQAGESGAKLAGGILKFTLQPYRANRELDALVDEFVDNAGALAGQMGGGENAELAAANMKLAEAEMAKAQAQTMKVQADAQGKMQEIALRASEAQAKAQADQQRLGLELEDTRGRLKETEARIEKIFAEIQAIGVKANVDTAKVQNDARKTDIEAVRTAADIQARSTDQAMNAQERERQAAMGERQQSFTETQAARQQRLAEKQAQEENA